MKQVLRYFFTLFIFFAVSFSLRAQVDGLFYSMTYGGGAVAYPFGVINQFDPLSNKDTAWYNFTGLNGAEPYGNFIQLNNGLLYGMTAYNGGSSYPPPAQSGTILQYNIQTGKDSILYIFPSTSNNYDSGEWAYGNLCHATNDLFYGMTYYGGTLYGSGVLFSFNYHTGDYRVLVQLVGRTVGRNPQGSLIQATNGLLYGMTTYNRTGYGGIFSYNINADTAILLYTFAGTPSDGANPRGNLLQVNDSMLYGLTVYGGTSDSGVLFSFNMNTNAETVLVNFVGPNGLIPAESLMQANDGYLYGTTKFGGLHDSGTIFRYNIATNTETVLYSFNGSDTDGYYPNSDLIQASDGRLYGNTTGNPPPAVGPTTGKNNWGTIFTYDLTNNKKKTLYYYNDTDGAYPYGDLLEVMSVTISAVKNPCPNDSSGSLTIHVRGGKPPFTYSWNTGATTSSITNLKAGIYSDTVWDARGMKFINVDTLYPLPITITFNIYNPCYDTSNGSVSVSVTGGTSPYTYLWSTGNTTDSISNLTAGTYTCTVTDASHCSLQKTLLITQSGPLVIDSIVATEQSYPAYNNGTVSVYVRGGIPPGDTACYYYLWSNGGPSDSSTITGLDSGTYAVCVTSCYGCGSSCSDSAKVLTGTKNLTKLGNLAKVFPVPSTGLINLSLAGIGFENIEITDALGRPVYRESLSPQLRNNILQIDLSSQPDGVYILYVNSQQGVLTRKIIIQK